MNYLLDTCTLLWLVNGSRELSSDARKAIASPQATIYLSVLTAAELSIKVGKGRIRLSQPVQRWIEQAVLLHHLTLLPLEIGPASAAGLLPWIHADPFDRILIATARHHSLKIITADRTIAQYPGINTLW